MATELQRRLASRAIKRRPSGAKQAGSKKSTSSSIGSVQSFAQQFRSPTSSTPNKSVMQGNEKLLRLMMLTEEIPKHNLMVSQIKCIHYTHRSIESFPGNKTRNILAGFWRCLTIMQWKDQNLDLLVWQSAPGEQELQHIQRYFLLLHNFGNPIHSFVDLPCILSYINITYHTISVSL